MAQLPADNNDYDMAKFFNPDGKTSMVQKDNKGDHQEVNPADALSDASVVCVYFSAHWCPACDMWTSDCIQIPLALSPSAVHALSERIVSKCLIT